MTDHQADSLIAALESKKKLRGMTENVRFLTRSVSTRKRLVRGGVAAVLVDLLRAKAVTEREEIIESVLGSLRNLTGAPDYLRVSTMMRWQVLQ